ncbi:hypothetical protein O1Q96_25655 [Streptomyces sp. Qhu-G9]|uniref:hypothetical protein n=1 Tax=Streptomyces sp. Qhu-G9 TaxID=3452799 RepID=UPI0022AC28B8|nr:hypothetical protein [Streptomyces aurantiacus]WAU82787.1 hypothetical protein O1Q96_25655 [Streptomyces aurantiacus]
MPLQLVGDVVLAVVAGRVLGRDVLVRRAAAAGVRLGVSELHRGDEGRDGRT